MVDGQEFCPHHPWTTTTHFRLAHPAGLATTMPDAATQTDAWDWQVAQVPRSVLVPTARSDSNEVDEEVSSGRATGAFSSVNERVFAPAADLCARAEPVARRSGPASLLSLPDELLEQIYQELYRQLSIDRKSLSYRRQRLMPSTSSLLVSKRIYDIGRAIWFSDWSDVDGRTRAMLLMHIDNYAPYVKSWSSFVSDAGLDFVLLRRFVNLTSLDLTFEDYVSLSIISNLLPRFGHLVSLRIASVVPDDGYGRMRLADYSLCICLEDVLPQLRCLSIGYDSLCPTLLSLPCSQVRDLSLFVLYEDVAPVPWRSVRRLTLGDDVKSSPSDADMHRNLVKPLKTLLEQVRNFTASLRPTPR